MTVASPAGVVRALFRYPVKSMQGEPVADVDVGAGGVDGDRTYALVDEQTGRVASAHHPDKWGMLLHCRARWDGLPGEGRVVVELPDGDVLAVGADLERRLGELTGRRVRLVLGAPEGGSYEIVHPDVEGTAPEEFVRYTLEAAGARDGRVGRLAVALDAAPGSLVDVSPVHVVTTSALAALQAGGGDADLRRFRPNVVVDTDGASGYVEQSWTGATLSLGGVRLAVTMPTPRCLVPTLAQAGLGRHRETLVTLARDNRLTVGPGRWACLGSYASVMEPGRVAVGAEVRLERG